jgi:hypothetical protein
MYAEGYGINKELTMAKRLVKEGFDAGEQSCEKLRKAYDLAY